MNIANNTLRQIHLKKMDDAQLNKAFALGHDQGYVRGVNDTADKLKSLGGYTFAAGILLLLTGKGYQWYKRGYFGRVWRVLTGKKKKHPDLDEPDEDDKDE